MQLILASASPRRKDILSMLELPFEIKPADVDESVLENENPTSYVLRLAIGKAQKISQDFPGATVIGSDLTIDLDGVSYAKAENRQEAREMLTTFLGRTHNTRCGFCVIHRGEVMSSGVTSTQITFKELSEGELSEYTESGEWQGLAGAYGVQGRAAEFVENFVGSYYDILGLPIYEITATLIKLGYEISESKLQEISISDKKQQKKQFSFS